MELWIDYFKSIKDNLEYFNKLLKAPNLIINIYNEKINHSLKKLNLSINNKYNLLNLNLLNIGNLINSPKNILKIKKISIRELSRNLEKNLIEKYHASQSSLDSNSRLLSSNSILKNLRKGYSILIENNKIIKSIKNIKVNTNAKAKIVDGVLDINIKKIN